MSHSDSNPHSKGHQPEVAILMGVYNGQTYLSEQLNSIANQLAADWGLFVSDDGSVDATRDVIQSFAAQHANRVIEFFAGPQQGFAANFLSLVCNPKIQASFFAYADQDDVWKRDKLSRALSWLQSIPAETPALYCSRTEYVDDALKHIAYSPGYRKPAVFANALVQNIASGNTMVFNQAARNLIQKQGSEVDIPLHDWWTYMLVTGVDGVVRFDHSPTVLYRQHQDNLWGMNAGWQARFSRIKKLFEGRFQGWNTRHLNALESASPYLTADNKRKVQLFAKSRNGDGLIKRLISLYQSGVYRQTLMANIGLITAVFFRKL